MRKFVAYLAFFFLVADLFGQSYQIGDLYTAPDGSQGIIYYLHPDGSGGWVVALQDASSSCRWSFSGLPPTGLPFYPYPDPNDYVANFEVYKLVTDDTAGYANTQLSVHSKILWDIQHPLPQHWWILRTGGIFPPLDNCSDYGQVFPLLAKE